MSMHYHLLIAQILFCLSVGWPAQEAYAYLDPGTGSLILQSLFAAVAALGAVLSLFWGRLRGLFSKGRENDATVDREENEREKS
jgi:hypothetical protein